MMIMFIYAEYVALTTCLITVVLKRLNAVNKMKETYFENYVEYTSKLPKRS